MDAKCAAANRAMAPAQSPCAQVTRRTFPDALSARSLTPGWTRLLRLLFLLLFFFMPLPQPTDTVPVEHRID